MKRIVCLLFLLLAINLNSHATIMYQPCSSEEQAIERADLVAMVRVTGTGALVENGVTQEWAKVISVEILTKGVSAKEHVTVLWNQGLADATLTKHGPHPEPAIGKKYRSHLRKASSRADFECVDPVWGFVVTDKQNEENKPAYIEHTVQSGDTLWSLAQKYYEKGWRWQILRVANFTKDAEYGVYPLKSGMKIHVPVFPMKRQEKKQEAPNTTSESIAVKPGKLSM
jgi:hypothetical protein